MPIFTVQPGTPRRPGEGLRIGTVRRRPRGVAKLDFARLDYYGIWFPNPAREDRGAGVLLPRWEPLPPVRIALAAGGARRRRALKRRS